jgi:hypothetical protein
MQDPPPRRIAGQPDRDLVQPLRQRRIATDIGPPPVRESGRPAFGKLRDSADSAG